MERYRSKLWLYARLILFLKLNVQVHLCAGGCSSVNTACDHRHLLFGKNPRADAPRTGPGAAARSPPSGAGTPGKLRLPFSKPQTSHQDFKTVPPQSSGVSRPELGSGWCKHTASAGDQDPNGHRGIRTGCSLTARLISSTYLHPINQVKEFAST